MKNILNTRKDEIVGNVGEDGLKKLQKVKLLKLIEAEIKELVKYFTLGQVLGQINNEFGLSISKTVFYDFCKKNIKKDEKLKPLKHDGVSQNREKKESILDEDELNAIAMFGSSSKNQVKD